MRTPALPANAGDVLRRINLDVIRSLSGVGFKYVSEPERKTDGFSAQDFLVDIRRQSRLGQSHTFTLGSDPDLEVEDKPEDCVFGVQLSSRYYPMLLDLNETSGGWRKETIPSRGTAMPPSGKSSPLRKRKNLS